MLRSVDVQVAGHSLAITYEPIEDEAPWVARVILLLRVNRPRRGHPIWLVTLERDITAYYEQRNRITGEWAHYALVTAIDDAAWQDLQDYNEARADEAADLEADERRLTC
jgi:hypothetical protein